MSKSKSEDPNELASRIVSEVTKMRDDYDFSSAKKNPYAKKIAEEKNPAAVALGRLGGLKGGKARAKKLSAAKRRKIAQKAAKSRWKNSSK